MTGKKVRLVSCVFALLAAWAAPARAEKTGDSVFDVGVGFGTPLEGLDLNNFGGGSEAPGGTGVALSPQYFYHLSPAFGLGAELTYMNFPSSSVNLHGPAATSSGDVLAFEAVGRYLFVPEGGVSPYLTAGIGVGRYAATVERGSATILDAATTGIAFFPGAGVKVDLGKAELMGELRWQAGEAGRAQFGTGLYDAFGFFMRLGWRL